MNLHEKLRMLRGEAGLSLDELARRAGTTRPLIERVEAGEKMPSKTQLIALAYGLGTAPESVLKGVDPNRALFSRYGSLIEVRYNGEFSLGVEVYVAGESRTAITEQLLAALDDVRTQIKSTPAWEPLPTTITVDHEDGQRDGSDDVPGE